MDYGAKENIIRCLVKRNCAVTVFPASTTDINVDEFDGIMLSNGPRRSWRLQDTNRNNKKTI